MRIYTIGHSTRSLDEFIALLGDAGTTLLVDVRIAPGSRRHPQFAGATLPPALAGHGIEYLHLKGLGGRRRPRPDSPHQAWRVEGFRGYADHMETGAFQEALDVVIARARERTVTLMCAEAVPWRCHRQLLADAFLIRGFSVRHIMDDGCHEHHLPPFAVSKGTKIFYPASAQLDLTKR
jgi:uncharacterized protein (DUF488 family)